MKKVVKKLMLASIGLILVLLAFHFFPINVTPSMPYGLYLRIPAWKIHVGDLVELDNPFAPGTFGVYNSRGLLKRVESITEDGLYVVMGEHQYSYDSRYFGAIGQDYIKHRIIPVFTFTYLPKWLSVGEDKAEYSQDFAIKGIGD